MGRLPSEWAGRPITMRIPYEMAGEIVLTTGQSGQQFPDALFMDNVDMPFECHRVVPRVIAQDNAGIAVPNQPNQDLLQSLIRARVNDNGKSVIMTKASTMLNTLTKGSSERTWEWADPYYLVRSESFQVVLDALTFPPIWDGAQIPANPATTPIISLRVSWGFQGFLCVVAAPSNTR